MNGVPRDLWHHSVVFHLSFTLEARLLWSFSLIGTMVFIWEIYYTKYILARGFDPEAGFPLVLSL